MEDELGGGGSLFGSTLNLHGFHCAAMGEPKHSET